MFKKLMKVVLSELFAHQDPNYTLIEQVILRYAYKKKFVTLDQETNEFVLTKKGMKLIKE